MLTPWQTRTIRIWCLLVLILFLSCSWVSLVGCQFWEGLVNDLDGQLQKWINFVLELFVGKSWWRSILGRFSQRFGWPAPTMNQICSWAVRSQDLIKGWTWYSKAKLNGLKIKPSKVGWCLFGSKEASPWKRLSSNFVISERVLKQEMASGVDAGWHRLIRFEWFWGESLGESWWRCAIVSALWNARIWCPLGVQRPGASRRQ